MQNIDIFPWDNHFNTGIEIIDTQHRKLVTLLNRLATQVAYQSNAEDLNAIFDELTEYTLYHFQTEEAIWSRYLNNNPLESEHQRVHQEFVDTVIRLKKEQDIKPLAELADEALGFLARWLASHILETDRYMAHIVVALQEGFDIDRAVEHAKEKMSGSGRILIEIILSIYGTLSSNTLQLMRELKNHQHYEQQLAYQDQYRQLLLELSSSFINLPLDEVEVVIEKALGNMAAFVGADRAYIFDYDFTAQTTSNTYEWCANGITPQIEELQDVPIDCIPGWAEIHTQGDYVLIQDVEGLQEGKLRDLLFPQEIRSLVTFPLFENNTCIGFVGFDAVKKLHTFTESEITLLRIFSKLLSNVSDRKRTETELSYERGFLKTLIQAIPDLIWLKDTEGIYLACNSRFEDFFGAKEAEIIGKTDYDFVDKALADLFRFNDTKVMQSNKPNINEEEVPFAKDGHKEVLHTTKVPMYGADGEIIGVLGVSRDITDMKKIQDELERKERYQRALLDNFPFIVWLKDEQSRFLAVNQHFADACRVSSPEEILGKTDFDVWPNRLAKAYREDDMQVLASGKSKNLEELVGTEGFEVWMETYKSPVILEKNTIGTVGFARDVSQKKALEKNLIMERNRFERYLQTVEAIIVSMDADGIINLINRKGCDILGYTQEELIGKQWFEFCLVQPEGMEELYPIFLDIVAGKIQGPEYYENALKTRSGKECLIAWHNSYLRDENDTIIGTLSAGEDITERKEAEETLRLAASVYTHSREGILISSVDNEIIDVNCSAERITGYSKNELLGKNPNIFSSKEHSQGFYKEMWKELNEKGFWSGEIWNRRRDGTVYAEMKTITAVKDNEGNLKRYVALFSDITPLKEQQKHLEYIAHYDSLTGLPNRVLLSDRLQQAMVKTHRNKLTLAVVYLDLDGFKEINDMYGHDNGDRLLSILADRMKRTLRDGDTIARLGGDEFVSVFLDLKTHEDCIPMLERLLIAASEVVNANEIAMKVTASLGVAFFDSGDTIDADQLLRFADQAMYQAKLLGKNRFHVFDAAQDATLRTHHEKLETIEQAFMKNEFLLYYQPKVNMRMDEVVGVEALIRWSHPQQGILSPAHFLPTIKNHILSIKIGEWVIEEVFKQIKEWKENGLNLVVSINIDAMHLLEGNIIKHLQSLLEFYPTIEPSDVKLEILETSALEDVSQVSLIMEKCKRIGITFSLDDFGTGYSSLTYLKRLPASELKIDQSFVRDMLHDPDDLAILDGVVSLASAFRRNLVAEGVESIKQGEILLRLGCEIAQGYIIAHPMPAKNIGPWIKTWKTDSKWKNIVPANRVDLPLLYAIVEHTSWMEKTLAFLSNEFSFLPEQNYNECRFGEWLYSGGIKQYGKDSAFREIEKLHFDVHIKVNECIKNKNNSAYNLEENIQEIKKLSKDLILVLENYQNSKISLF
ncbi:bacteriohemerythrin [bacterium]|nr:bacteriohemerythrin [bacterium]MBU1993353.1 bacteriohemerythrin [bacterium]